MSDERIIIDKIVGSLGYGEYYGVNEIFDNGEDFQGATGTILRPIGNEEKNRMTDSQNPELHDRYYEVWQGAVESGQTQLGLKDWIERQLDNWGLEFVFDFSDYDMGVKVANLYNQANYLDPDSELYAEFSECIGGGRVFHWVKPYLSTSVNMAISRDKFTKLYNEDILHVIVLAEMNRYDDAVELLNDIGDVS